MSNTFVPFAFNPTLTKVVDNASYTVPANKYARVSVLRPASDSTFNFDLDGAASSVEIKTSSKVNANNTAAGNTVTIYTVPNDCWFEGQYNVNTATGSVNTLDFGGSAGWATGVSTQPIPIKMGPGETLRATNVGGSLNVTLTGFLRVTNTTTDFWITAGDQIEYPGAVLIQEFDQPS